MARHKIKKVILHAMAGKLHLQNFKSRIQWLLLGLLLALVDAAIVGVFRALIWVVDHSYKWGLLSWFLGLILIIGLRYLVHLGASKKEALYQFRLGQKEFSRQFSLLRWHDLAPLSPQAWYQNQKLRSELNLAEGALAFFGVQLIVLLGVMAYFQWLFALLTLILALIFMRPNTSAKESLVPDWDLKGLMRWWDLGRGHWLGGLQSSAASRLRRSHGGFLWAQALQSLGQSKRILKSEFRAQLISALVLGLAAWSYLSQSMDLGTLLGLLISVLLAHKPLKNVYGLLLRKLQIRRHLSQIEKAHKVKVFESKDESMRVNLPYLQVGPAFASGPFAFELEPGEALLLLGPSGSGKSTLFRRIFYGADAGGVEVSLPAASVFMEQVPQIPQLSSNDLHEIFSVNQFLFKELGIASVVANLLESNTCDQHGFVCLERLSGGELQRFVLALILSQASSAVILDEPFSRLEWKLALRLVHYVREYCQAKNLILVLSSHLPLEHLNWNAKVLELK